MFEPSMSPFGGAPICMGVRVVQPYSSVVRCSGRCVKGFALLTMSANTFLRLKKDEAQLCVRTCAASQAQHYM